MGIDIAGLGGNAFAALQPAGAAGPSLYRVDLTTGAARLLGALSTTGGTVEDITVVPAAASASPEPQREREPVGQRQRDADQLDEPQPERGARADARHHGRPGRRRAHPRRRA